MNYTEQYHLRKPEPTDFYAVEDSNENMEIIDEVLDQKVDKVAGKQLSTEDYTAEEKSKLAEIEEGATNYQHPDTHPAEMITQDSTHRFVTDSQKASWNAKPDAQREISNSVASTSTTTAASSKAVKTAYDKGVEALHKAEGNETQLADYAMYKTRTDNAYNLAQETQTEFRSFRAALTEGFTNNQFSHSFNTVSDFNISQGYYDELQTRLVI